MRKPVGWPRSRGSWLQVVCACCALWNVPAVAAGATERIVPASGASTTTSTRVSAQKPTSASYGPRNDAARQEASDSGASDNTDSRFGNITFDGRVLLLLALGCFVGLMVGRVIEARRGPRMRLLNKPKKTTLQVLVPPGPPPRLVPGDSPKAVRARSILAPVPRQTPPVTRGSRFVDYLAVFSDPGDRSEAIRVDYLLEADGSSVPEGGRVEEDTECDDDQDSANVA